VVKVVIAQKLAVRRYWILRVGAAFAQGVRRAGCLGPLGFCRGLASLSNPQAGNSAKYPALEKAPRTGVRDLA
jgi:hypothetical protein